MNGNAHVSRVWSGMMIDVNSALQLIAENSLEVGKEKRPLSDLNGRVLAEPLLAQRAQPPFDRVAMDGIAVCLNPETSSHTFKLEGVQKAGEPPLKLNSLSGAIEVMTGAILPLGVNTVIPYEDLSIESGLARVLNTTSVKKHKNIHFVGSDFSVKQRLLEPGTMLSSASIALIAAQGSADVTVYKLPKVAVVSTGDELIEPGQKCQPWEIWRSNPFGVQAELKRFGYRDKNMDLFHVKDSREEIFSLMRALLDQYQVLILSGGVSMGKFDYVHTVMADLGVREVFHKIKQKPGKPMYFGVGELGQNVFGLPGNPVSALICMKRYIVPAIKKALKTRCVQYFAELGEDITFEKNFSLFQAVSIEPQDSGKQIAQPISLNGSGDFFRLGISDGFLQLPADKTLYKRGETYPFFEWSKV